MKTNIKRLFLVVLATPLFALADQTCLTTVEPSTAGTDFSLDEADGSIVTHTRTGLVWQRCLAGQTYNDNGTSTNFGDDTCDDSPDSLTWEAALALANADPVWRLPNVKELATINEQRCINPAQNTAVFIDQSDGRDTGFHTLWTASPSSANATESWVWDTSGGNSDSQLRTGTAQVRLVRDGS